MGCHMEVISYDSIYYVDSVGDSMVFDIKFTSVSANGLEGNRIYWIVDGQSLRVSLEIGDYVHRVRVPGGRWSDWKHFTVLTRVGLQ